jgi:hypothetical protein
MLYLATDSAGLVLNIFGVGLVFWFGLPAELSRADRELLFPREPADITRARMYDVLGYAGLILLMAGFGVQLLSNALEVYLAGMPA